MLFLVKRLLRYRTVATSRHFNCHAEITRFAQDAKGVFLLFNGLFILLVATGDRRGALVTV